MAAPQPEEVRRTAVAIALGVLLGLVLRLVRGGRVGAADAADAGDAGDAGQPSSDDPGSK